MNKRLAMLFVLSLFFVKTGFSQLSNTEILKLKKQYESEKSGKNTSSIKESRLLKEMITDSLSYNDSIQAKLSLKDTIPKKEIVTTPSIYESLLKKQTIHPDSLIKTLEIFGHSVFNKNKSPHFTSDNQISVTADYPIAPGDEIVLLLWGRINEEYRLVVDRNGQINLPRIGPVSVAGQQFKTVQTDIINRIQNIEGVQASITMGTLSDMRIFIVGEVAFPGQYTINALTNVTNALFAAGGFSKQGSMREVYLKRNGKTIQKFDFYDFLLSGNSFNSTRLKTDDVIYVPVVTKMAAIVGNVRRSALYELKGKTILSDVITLAGGLAPTAWINKIQVERFQENNQQVVFDVEVVSAENIPAFEIEDGDVIKIFPVVLHDKNAVFLSGNITRPGKYEFQENMKVSNLISSYDQLLPETYFNYAVIRRQEPPSFEERILSFNLDDAMKDSSSKENIELKPLDNVMIFNRDYFEPERSVSIDGAVTNTGTYKLLKNMRVKDLILEAGGLSQNASTERGELYSRTFGKNSVKTKITDFSISAAMQDDPSHNLFLSKFDHVSIRQKQGWEEQKTISLLGEFNYPGTYIVLEGETLGALIKRAGGFKPDAYLAAAIFTRESIKELEKKRMEDYANKLESDIVSLSSEMTSKGNTAPEIAALLDQQKNLLEKLKRTEPTGRVVIDFENENNYKTFHVEDNDIMYLPKNKNTVSVLGEVFNPATFVLEKQNASVTNYIELSGGYKDNANKKDVYVIKANGSVRTNNMVHIARYDLEPGDAVVVPFKLPISNQRFKLILETTKDILAITSSSLLIATAIASLK